VLLYEPSDALLTLVRNWRAHVDGLDIVVGGRDQRANFKQQNDSSGRSWSCRTFDVGNECDCEAHVKVGDVFSSKLGCVCVCVCVCVLRLCVVLAVFLLPDQNDF
jgi:hypothetical protein